MAHRQFTLFDARGLHIVRRGYSARDQPGERFDVWVIDYGAYVDLLHTNYAPQGLLPFKSDDGEEQHIGLDVSAKTFARSDGQFSTSTSSKQRRISSKVEPSHGGW
ncbi:hypothetical protein ACFV27_20895 [Streptomyces antimycoticus]|uniref:hypothetical protein n=1 Tax=Streptomyces antimycoticus TaxID=68175 RepID=UPI0036A43EA0